MLMGLAELRFQTVRVCSRLSSCQGCLLYVGGCEGWVRFQGAMRCDVVGCAGTVRWLSCEKPGDAR